MKEKNFLQEIEQKKKLMASSRRQSIYACPD